MAGEWTGQLPDDLKTNEAFTGFPTLGDFAKSHLEMKGKLSESDGKIKEFEGKFTDLTNKLNNAIPKIGEKATDAEKAAYFKALGVPEKPAEYEFPKQEGIEHDQKMVEWAQSTFHTAHLSKEQAALIGTAWNGFIKGMVEAEQQAETEDKTKAETALKAELGDKYTAAVELTKRLLKENASEDDLKFLDESGLGNHPALIRLIVKFARKTGEDSTLKGGPPKGETPAVGLKYNMPSFE